MRVARVLFARLPQRGHVKSRLAAELGDDAAFEIYLWLLRVQNRSFRKWPEQGHAWSNFVFYAPLVSRLRARLKFYPNLSGMSLRFRPQCEGDLGARLKHACHEALKHHDLALIWGADIPTLPKSIEAQAIALAPQSVITLARDGGYAFLSVAREGYAPEIFDRIRWSTSVTGHDQIRALQRAGVNPVVAGKVTDLDRLKDLTRVIRELEAAGSEEELRDLRKTVNLFSQ